MTIEHRPQSQLAPEDNNEPHKYRPLRLIRLGGMALGENRIAEVYDQILAEEERERQIISRVKVDIIELLKEGPLDIYDISYKVAEDIEEWSWPRRIRSIIYSMSMEPESLLTVSKDGLVSLVE